MRACKLLLVVKKPDCLGEDALTEPDSSAPYAAAAAVSLTGGQRFKQCVTGMAGVPGYVGSILCDILYPEVPQTILSAVLIIGCRDLLRHCSLRTRWRYSWSVGSLW